MLEQYSAVLSASPLLRGRPRLAEGLCPELLALDRGNSLSLDEKICVLLSGRAVAEYPTCDGRRIFISRLAPSDVCDLSRFVVNPHQNGTLLLLFSKSRLINCGESVLLRNMLAVAEGSEKSLLSRIECVSMPTLRQKIMTYLSSRSEPLRIFSVAETREQLAEYLNADRSALSRELSLMKKDGIIDFDGGYFKILKLC